MSVIDTLVYDRTQADVSRALALARRGWAKLTDVEKTEWLAGLKGAYNADDLNRVGSATTYLSALLVQLPKDMLAYLASLGVAPDAFFAVPYNPEDYGFSGKTDWAEADIPTAQELADYLAKVALLRASFEYDTDPLPESMEKLTFSGANAIEKALALLQEAADAWQADKKHWADKVPQAWYFSGDLYAGEI